MSRLSIGSKQVIPLLLPGLVLVVGFVVLLATKDWIVVRDWVDQLLTDVRESESGGFGALLAAGAAFGGAVTYVSSLVVGVLLAIAGGYLEGHVFDPYRARRMNLTPEEFREQWMQYVDSLDTSSNPYVDGFVDIFLFTLRLALALVPLSLVSFAIGGIPLWVSVALLAVGLLMFRLALSDHCDLAEFRSRRFGSVRPTDAAV